MALRRRGILGQSQGQGRASWSAAARPGQALKEPSDDPLGRRALTTCPSSDPSVKTRPRPTTMSEMEGEAGKKSLNPRRWAGCPQQGPRRPQPHAG